MGWTPYSQWPQVLQLDEEQRAQEPPVPATREVSPPSPLENTAQADTVRRAWL